MKENEPKVKDSQKWWDRGCESNTDIFITHGQFKATYDRLFTLEAKIEELKCVKSAITEDGLAELFVEKVLKQYESELAELVKELKI